MSTTPAFSPGPTSTRGPVVGNPRRWRREDLYEQCSLQSTLKMPSSRRFGSRPRSSRMRAYSDSLSPCCAMTSLLRAMSVEERGQYSAAVGVAEQRLGVPLGVGHHPQHVPRGVHDAGDVRPASVGVLQVAKDHLPLTLQPPQPLVVDEVAPVAVGDGDLEGLAWRELRGEAGPRLLRPEHHVL